MKHNIKVTLILVAIFFISQLLGLFIVSKYVAQKTINPETGLVENVTYKNLPLEMQRPEVEESSSYLYILGAVLIGTVLVLLLVKFRGFKLWKTWFFISVALCLTIAFSAFVNQYIAIALGIIFAILKIYKPNVILHNFTEVFIYGGLAAIFVPIMNLFAVVVLLLLISVYDMIAVWQSKHMVTMAKFQTESKVFAGLSIPYTLKTTPKTEGKTVTTKKTTTRKDKEETKSAILGGGDIGFPLLFAGVVMKTIPFTKVIIIPAVTAVALFLLLYYAEKDKFYPAMPFLTAGCLVGYGLMLLL
jgi:presenilin-like A22 family membrane protease